MLPDLRENLNSERVLDENRLDVLTKFSFISRNFYRALKPLAKRNFSAESERLE
jgi:hypothetical protein